VRRIRDSDNRGIKREQKNYKSCTLGTETGLEDDVYWREGSLKAMLAHLICTMISPLSMLDESAEERIIEKSEKPRR
jgi:hypothetical protein